MPSFDIDAVVAYLAVVYVVETVNQVRNGGLACAGSADKGYLLTGLSPHAYVVQHHLVGVVAEVDVVKHDFAAELLVGDGAVGLVRVLPSPDVGALFGLVDFVVRAFLGVDELDVALVLLGHLIHELKDSLRAGSGGDDEVDLHGELAYRLVKLLLRPQRRQPCARGRRRHRL